MSAKLGFSDRIKAAALEEVIAQEPLEAAFNIIGLRNVIEEAVSQGCSCRSTTEENWHSPRCMIPKFREALERSRA